jgi:oxygen-dependent protoporphyrinogen oxidase
MGSVRFVVVGGGIAGLAAALRLRERAGVGAEILLIDRADRLGGKLRTVPFAGQPVETGAETFLVTEQGRESAALALARRVGLGEDIVHPARLGAAIALDGRLHPIPPGTLLGVPADPSTLNGLATTTDADHDLGRPLLAPGEDIAVAGLVRPRLGYEVVNHLIEPLLGGVYAGRADRLSLAATMPGLHEAAGRETTLAAAVRSAMAASPRPPGSPVFATVRGGMSRLVDAVADAAGATVHLGLPVRGLARTGQSWQVVVGSTRDPSVVEADAVILAVPAIPAARLLRGIDEGAAAEVGPLGYASVALVSLALPAGTALPDLSGFLVPPVADYAIKAATFFTSKWPHLARQPDGAVLVRASLGRYCEERVLQRTDADLVAVAHADLSDILSVRLPEPFAARVNRWGGGLPQYGVGHVDRVRRARLALPQTLGLAGAGYDGVGIAACVRSGERAADVAWTALESDDHG